MEIREEPGFRVVTVEPQELPETLILADATGWEVLTVTRLPDEHVKVTLARSTAR